MLPVVKRSLGSITSDVTVRTDITKHGNECELWYCLPLTFYHNRGIKASLSLCTSLFCTDQTSQCHFLSFHGSTFQHAAFKPLQEHPPRSLRYGNLPVSPASRRLVPKQAPPLTKPKDNPCELHNPYPTPPSSLTSPVAPEPHVVPVCRLCTSKRRKASLQTGIT